MADLEARKRGRRQLTKPRSGAGASPRLTVVRGGAPRRPVAADLPLPEMACEDSPVVMQRGADGMLTVVGCGAHGQWLFELILPETAVQDRAVVEAVADLRYAIEPFRPRAAVPPRSRLEVMR